MELTLRPYQEEAATACLAMSETRPALLVLPTGMGKTVVMVEMARRMCARVAKPVLLLVHREELAAQAKARLERDGFWVLVEKAEQRPPPAQIVEAATQRPTVVIGSVPTMRQKQRRQRLRPDLFSLIMVDEAHHAIAKSYRGVLEHFEAPVIGVTATAGRKGLADHFQVAYQKTLLEGVEGGWLVPPRFFVVENSAWDLSGLRICGGRDVSDAELAESFGEEAFAEFVRLLEETLREHGQGLVFTPSVAAAAQAARWLAARAVSAAFVEAKTPADDRRRMVERFRAGHLTALCNCGVLTEGFDAPDSRVVAMARPTKSQTLYTQIIGRGLRPLAAVIAGVESAKERRERIAASDKPYAFILDVQGTGARFADKLVSPASLLPGVEQVEEAASKLKTTETEFDFDALRAEAAAMHRTLEERRRAMEQAATRRSAVSRARSPELREMALLVPVGKRTKRRPTSRQLSYIYRLCKRIGKPQRVCSDYWRAAEKEWSFEQAHAVIGRLQQELRASQHSPD